MTTFENFWKDFKQKREKFQIASKEVKAEYLIAAKSMDVANGKLYEIPVKKQKILPNYTVHLSLYATHPLGNAIAVGEKLPRPMDIERNVEFVRFLASKSGNVKKGDLLGHYVAVTLKSLSK
jgi:hypothetical protein